MIAELCLDAANLSWKSSILLQQALTLHSRWNFCRIVQIVNSSSGSGRLFDIKFTDHSEIRNNSVDGGGRA